MQRLEFRPDLLKEMASPLMQKVSAWTVAASLRLIFVYDVNLLICKLPIQRAVKQSQLYSILHRIQGPGPGNGDKHTDTKQNLRWRKHSICATGKILDVCTSNADRKKCQKHLAMSKSRTIMLLGALCTERALFWGAVKRGKLRQETKSPTTKKKERELHIIRT